MGSEGCGWFRFTCARQFLVAVTVTLAICGAGAACQSTSPLDSGPVLTHRPQPGPVIPEGKIQLDVVVNDSAGKPVQGLQPWDFKILDNDQPRKVMSFHSYDGVAVKPNPPVEVILVMDMLNLPFQQVAFVRGEVDHFLRQNGGHLKQPTTLILLTDAGIRVQPRPSVDGNAIATVVDAIKGSVSSINPAMGGEGYLERFQRSERAMDNIAQNEAKKPGRKLLIWIGPGWPMLNRPANGYTEKQQRRNFDAIVELTTALRAARIAVHSVAPGTGLGTTSILYQQFMKPVKSWHEAEFGNMALRVLALQTGGKIMGPDNDLVSQINRCVEDANAFYRISFDPPTAGDADEYHEVKVLVDKPGLTVRTNTGYYNEPAGH